MLTEREFEIYDKFQEGDYIQDDEREDIETLTSIGLARIGFASTGAKVRETAILTPLGKNIIQREKLKKNPIRRFFYSIVNSSM